MDTNEQKVHEVLRCTKCKRVFKQADQNEFNLCPKCLANIQNTVDAAEKTTEVADAEAATTQETAEDIKEVTDEQFISDKPLQASEVAIGATDDVIDDVIAAQAEKNTSAEIKPGQYVRDKFQELIIQNLITEDRVAELLDSEYCKKERGFRYPFLIPFDSSKPMSAQNKIKGSVRYGSKIISINGKEYLLCNDIYQSTVPKFNKWLAEKFGK